MAIESLAVFNAVTATEGTPGYLVSLTAPEGASAVAAAAQAAHDSLVPLFPSQSALFDAQLALSLGAVTDGQRERWDRRRRTGGGGHDRTARR